MSASLSTLRTLLDEALVQLRGIVDPNIPVKDAERDIAEALRRTYGALAAGADSSARRSEARGALGSAWAARDLLQGTGPLDPAAAHGAALLSQAVEILLADPATPNEGAPVLPRAGEVKPVVRALQGEPSLLDVPRGVIRPVVPLPELLPREKPPEEVALEAPPVTTASELEARVKASLARLALFDAGLDKEPPPDEDEEEAAPPVTVAEAEAEHFGIQIEESELIRQRARACFEDLAALGNMRRPFPGNPWASPRTEERLLTKVDALVACGDEVFSELVTLLEDRAVPDPEMTWATLFFFGSLAGQDALDELLRVSRCVPLETPDMLETVSDALALAPHPGLEGALRKKQAEGDAVWRAIAIRVLGRKRLLEAQELLDAATDPDPRIALAAAQALGPSLGEVPRGVLQALLSRPEADVVRAALVGGLERGLPGALQRAEEWVREGRGDHADAALFVAIARGSAALEWLRPGAPQSATAATALGWLGHLEGVPVLLEGLSAKSEAVKAASVEALQRLTGASLTDEEPQRTYPKEALPFTTGHPRPGSVGPLCVDPAPWTEWWKQYGQGAGRQKRYRWGHPWTFEDNLAELSDFQSQNEQRLLAYLELVAYCPTVGPLDMDHFVTRQLAQLADMRKRLEARPPVAGSWPP